MLFATAARRSSSNDDESSIHHRTCTTSIVDQLCSFTAQLIQFKVVNHGRCSRGMLFICFCTQVNLHHVFKMSVFRYVCMYQKLLYICEHELSELDMSINIQKTCCLRIGPRHNAPCAAISMSSGTAIPRVDKIRYLGVFIARSHVLRCDLDHAKKIVLSRR